MRTDDAPPGKPLAPLPRRPLLLHHPGCRGGEPSSRKDYGFEAADSSGQVIVSKLKAGGPAEIAGIMIGDRVVEVAGRPIDNNIQMQWVLVKSEVEKKYS